MALRIPNSPIPLISFTPRVDVRGFEWVKAGDFAYEEGSRRPSPDTLLLVERGWNERANIDAEHERSMRPDSYVSYEPRELDNLFLRVADLGRWVPPDSPKERTGHVEVTPAEILNFANRYGHLGLAQDDLGVTLSETFETWQRFLSGFREAVELQVAIQEARRKGEPTIILRWLPRPGEGWKPTAVPLADADSIFDRIVNDHQVRALSGNLVNTGPDQRGEPLYKYIIEAKTLAEFVWFQLATVVADNGRLRRCVQCGKWLPVVPRPGDREAKTTCSSACRQKAYNQRLKEEAAAKAKVAAKTGGTTARKPGRKRSK